MFSFFVVDSKTFFNIVFVVKEYPSVTGFLVIQPRKILSFQRVSPRSFSKRLFLFFFFTNICIIF